MIPEVYLHCDPYTRAHHAPGKPPLSRQRMYFLLLLPQVSAPSSSAMASSTTYALTAVPSLIATANRLPKTGNCGFTGTTCTGSAPPN